MMNIPTLLNFLHNAYVILLSWNRFNIFVVRLVRSYFWTELTTFFLEPNRIFILNYYNTLYLFEMKELELISSYALPNILQIW